MVKAKLTLLLAALLCSFSLGAQQFNWETVPMDGHMVGASVPSADNVKESLGEVLLGVYTAPNGREYTGTVAKVAKILIDAQPSMAFVKEKVGYAPHDMIKHSPECELSNMVVDFMMRCVEDSTGIKVDAGLLNFGGLRTNIHAGDVVLDTFLSMLPFKNYVYVVKLKGADLRALFEAFAEVKIQIVGGVRLVYKDHRLVSAEIGGEELDDEKIYNLATVDFLLNGGDHISAARNAVDLIETGILLRDSVLPYVRSLYAQGKNLEYVVDGRITVL